MSDTETAAPLAAAAAAAAVAAASGGGCPANLSWMGY